MKIRPFIIVTLVALLLSVFCVIPCGCVDGYLSVTGTTYEWIDAPAGATSEIYIENVELGREVEPTMEKMQEEIASDISLVPLKGVNINIGPKESIEKEGKKHYYLRARSDLEGDVDDGWVIAPGKDQYLVRASKYGYVEVVGEVEHSGVSNLVIIVILVRDND
jgi:hypothetical protein